MAQNGNTAAFKMIIGGMGALIVVLFAFMLNQNANNIAELTKNVAALQSQVAVVVAAQASTVSAAATAATAARDVATASAAVTQKLNDKLDLLVNKK